MKATVQITNDLPMTYWPLRGKTLEVKGREKVWFATGEQLYYSLEFDGDTYKVPARFLTLQRIR